MDDSRVERVKGRRWSERSVRVIEAAVDTVTLAVVVLVSAFAVMLIAVAAPVTLTLSAIAGFFAPRRVCWSDLETA